MVIQRGELWWASLQGPRGSEPGYRRPVLIIQSDAFNKSNIGTVLVAAITINLRLADAPGNVRLRSGEGGLRRTSVVNVSQIITLDKQFFAERIGRLSASSLRQVDDGLRRVLALQSG